MIKIGNKDYTVLAEAYLEPSRTPTMELFCEISGCMSLTNSQKSSIVDVRLSCEYASGSKTFFSCRDFIKGKIYHVLIRERFVVKLSRSTFRTQSDL